MALYRVNAARIGRDGKVEAVRGYETNGLTNFRAGDERAFSVSEVLELTEKGNAFYVTLTNATGRVSAGLILLGGEGSLRKDFDGEEHCMSELPAF